MSELESTGIKEIIRRMAFNPAEVLCFRGFCLLNQKTMELNEWKAI